MVGQYFPEAIKDGEVDFTALKEEMGDINIVKEIYVPKKIVNVVVK